ncbi:hypothetical protein MGH68_03515 [Erysipelothrix sp. D19-032]
MDKKDKIKWISVVLLAFVAIDLWNGNTYHYTNVASMLYLAFVVLVILGILFLDRQNYKKFTTSFSVIAIGFVVVFIIGGLMSSKIFNAKSYANVIGPVKQVEFADLYKE